MADTTIGRVPETAACADKFKREGVDITLSAKLPKIFFVAHRQKRQIPTGICRFQLNPPLRVGEIFFDDEIQLRWVKSASTADGWI